MDDTTANLRRSVFISCGQVSVCWTGSDLGMFESDRAMDIAEGLWNEIQNALEYKDQQIEA